MKYTYAYKTSDGQRHEASIDAKCREEVFAALRAQGIKAIKVVAADGSKANGVVRGVRKRIVALVVVSLLFASVIAVIFSFRAGEHSNIQTFQNSNNSSLEAQQIIAMVEGMKREARAYLAAGSIIALYLAFLHHTN